MTTLNKKNNNNKMDLEYDDFQRDLFFVASNKKRVYLFVLNKFY